MTESWLAFILGFVVGVIGTIGAGFITFILSDDEESAA